MTELVTSERTFQTTTADPAGAQRPDYSGGYCENPFVVEFYDHLPPNRLRSDAEFFMKFARHSMGETLELGCGTGRVLIEFARAGLRITGLDTSSEMLSVCERKLLKESPSVRSKVNALVKGDMRRFSLGRKFSLITVPYYTFNYLQTIEDQISCLSHISEHLGPGGTLVLDLPNPDLTYLTDDRYLSEFGDEATFKMGDGRSVRRRYRVIARDLVNQIVQAETIYYVSYPNAHKERLVNDLSIRYLFRYEVDHLLARCGFTVKEAFGDYEQRPFGSHWPGEMIFIAVKK